MTLLSDPENRRGYGTGVIDATSPYRVECEYTPRKDRSPEQYCSEQHALTYKLNSEGEWTGSLSYIEQTPMNECRRVALEKCSLTN